MSAKESGELSLKTRTTWRDLKKFEGGKEKVKYERDVISALVRKAKNFLHLKTS